MTDGDKHYRVKATCVGGATVRAAPRQSGAVLGRLNPGEDFYGEKIDGERHFVTGLGSSAIWIRSFDLRCVWSGMLEEVPE
jgi:hypothetical protein